MNPVTEPDPVVMYAATRIPGPDGRVDTNGDPLSEADAVQRLRDRGDIVVCGKNRKTNRNKARELMVAAFGSFEEDQQHSGRMALPHFHPPNHSPEGIHAFFEAQPRHARKTKQ